MTYTQQPMFGHEDTPLFSGTVQTAKPDIFQAQEIHTQGKMYSCVVCKDTCSHVISIGLVSCRFCNKGAAR